MVWFLGVLIVLVIGATVVVATGRGGAMRPVYDDRPDLLVPDAPLTGDALRSVRFSVGFRGYRMDEVDTLLARLADQLDDHAGAGPDAAYRRPDTPPRAPEDQRPDESPFDDRHDAEERP